MDHPHLQQHQQYSSSPLSQSLPNKHKKRLTEEQARVLETNFTFNNKLDTETKAQLAQELGVPPRQVAIWYQNRRAREKNQSLEADHNALRVQLDNVLEDNARLKEESMRLKAELARIHSVLSTFNSGGSCESSMIQKQNLEREYYDCLVGRDGGQFMASAASNGYNFFGSSV